MSAPLIGTAEAARRLRCSADVVRLYCRQGRIKAVNIGRQWLIAPAEVRRFAKIPRKKGWPLGKPRKS